MLMSQGTLVRTASKDILARCMATEDITVEHRADAETAYFDTHNRVLCLPVWQDMDDSLYDMLVGHEVSHALHTPGDGWQEFIGKGPGAQMRHMFVNVVEDARIERMIKSMFPGLRRDFASAYQNLHDRDLFQVTGKDTSGLPLIDRLNLEFKLGILNIEDVSFSTDEQQYVTRMAETETFEDVIELARELYEMQVEQDEQEKQEQEQQEQDSAGVPNSGEGEEGEGQGSSPDSSDGDEDSEGAGSSAGGLGDDETTEEGQGSSGSQTNESGEDSGQSMEDDTDDGESADSSEGEPSEGEGDSALDYDDYKNNENCAGSTQNSFERGVEDMRDNSGSEYSYKTLPSANLDKIVVDYPAIAELWSPSRYKHWNETRNTETRANSSAQLRNYQNSIKATVAQMVQQFQMKQAADADKKTEIAKTGVLDTVSMINYRWSEDIFRKNEVHPDGKNHGMVMYLDWSGSMHGILQDTVEQLFVLVEFCRKVGIPYEVYAFSSNMYCPIEDRYSDEWDKWHEDNGTSDQQWVRQRESDCEPHAFQLYNFLSSRMNKREYHTALNNLWLLTESQNYYHGHPIPSCLSLGCTPLNESIVCAMQQVPAFQRENDIQIVNTVFLTDGEGHGMGLRGYRGYGRTGKSFVRDSSSRKVFDVSQSETSGLLDMLRDRTGTNLVGIRLHDSKNINHLRWSLDDDNRFEELSKQYKTLNYITLPSSYDEYFIVKGNLKVETDALESLGDNESYTRIKNAFIKGGNRKKSSRVIASKMVDIFAA